MLMVLAADLRVVLGDHLADLQAARLVAAAAVGRITIMFPGVLQVDHLAVHQVARAGPADTRLVPFPVRRSSTSKSSAKLP